MTIDQAVAKIQADNEVRDRALIEIAKALGADEAVELLVELLPKPSNYTLENLF